MNYGNPVQIGDKVSVAAMGTRGDKRGWGVLPPPNTDPNWLLPRPETLFLAQLCSWSLVTLFRLEYFIQPKDFQKKTDFCAQMATSFSDMWVPKHLLPLKRIKAFRLKTTIFCPKIYFLGHFWANRPCLANSIECLPPLYASYIVFLPGF